MRRRMVWVFSWRRYMTQQLMFVQKHYNDHVGRLILDWHFSLSSRAIKEIVASYLTSHFSFNFSPLLHPSCINILELDCRGIYDGPIPRSEESYRACVCLVSNIKRNSNPLHLQRIGINNQPLLWEFYNTVHYWPLQCPLSGILCRWEGRCCCPTDVTVLCTTGGQCAGHMAKPIAFPATEVWSLCQETQRLHS
jgi:hypothetical protein